MKMTLTDKVQDWIDEQKKLGKENDEIIGTYFVDGTTITQITKSGSGKGFGLKTQLDCIDFSDKEELQGEYAIVHSWWKLAQARVLELHKENEEWKIICVEREKMNEEKSEVISQLQAQLEEFKAFTGLKIENIIVKDSDTGEWQ